MNEYVVPNGTYTTMMAEIYERSLAGERPGILLVFLTALDAEDWLSEWTVRYPYQPHPTYVTISNTLATRGRRWKYVCVYQAGMLADGWRNEKLVSTVLVGVQDDGEVTYVYDQGDVYAHTFSEYPPPGPPPKPAVKQGILRRYLKRAQPELDGQ